MNLDEQIAVMNEAHQACVQSGATTVERFDASQYASILASLRELKRLRARVAELENSLQRQWPRQTNADGGWTLDYCWLCVVKQKSEALYQGEDDGISLEQAEAVLLAVQRMP